MNVPKIIFTLLLLVSLGAGCIIAPAQSNSDYLLLAQVDDEVGDANEQLKLAALEGLMSASPERALPLLKKVLDGNNSEAVKSRALFVLSQIGSTEADEILVGLAGRSNDPLRQEAIRMIGISGNRDSVALLADIYRNGDADVREEVLNAYLIADAADPVYEVARNAVDEDEFNAAVRTLAAMGATDKLRLLSDRDGNKEGLIQAYAISGDLASLRKIVAEAGSARQRTSAISAIGIVGGREANEALIDIYRTSSDKATKRAALQGLLISGHDEGVLELFRSSQDAEEKQDLLRTLVNMNSDLALDIIDSTLEGN